MKLHCKMFGNMLYESEHKETTLNYFVILPLNSIKSATESGSLWSHCEFLKRGSSAKYIINKDRRERLVYLIIFSAGFEMILQVHP